MGWGSSEIAGCFLLFTAVSLDPPDPAQFTARETESRGHLTILGPSASPKSG